MVVSRSTYATTPKQLLQAITRLFLPDEAEWAMLMGNGVLRDTLLNSYVSEQDFRELQCLRLYGCFTLEPFVFDFVAVEARELRAEVEAEGLTA